jgi:hypothetical protein
MNLRDPQSESVATFRELLAQSRNSPWTLNVLASNAEIAKRHAERLDALELVKMSVTLDNFVPAEQDEKLAIIEEIALLVGPELLASRNPAIPGAAEQIIAIEDLSTALASFTKNSKTTPLVDAARRLNSSLKRLLAAIKTKDVSARARILQDLHTSVLGSLPARLRSLETSLEADRITPENLPPDLVARWRAADDTYRVEVFPRDDLNDAAALRRFVNAVRMVAPEAIGFPVIYLDAGDAVVKAFQQAFVLALIAITGLLFILLRPKSDVLLVLLPLLLAGALTGAISVLLDIPFNFANVIALPLLLGIGVDNGIHMVHRMRAAPPASGQILQTSTARAVLFSSLTTVCSFGNLALSPHRGMASMGIMLSIGIGFVLLCTLIVLPAFMGLVIHSGKNMKGKV